MCCDKISPTLHLSLTFPSSYPSHLSLYHLNSYSTSPTFPLLSITLPLTLSFVRNSHSCTPFNPHSLSLPLIHTHRGCPKLIAELKCDKDCHGTDEPAYVHGRQKQINQCDPHSPAQYYQNCTG